MGAGRRKEVKGREHRARVRGQSLGGQSLGDRRRKITVGGLGNKDRGTGKAAKNILGAEVYHRPCPLLIF